MSKFKKWLYNKFLPAWCKDDLTEENTRLIALIGKQRQELDRLNAYISGMETALRRCGRISIHTGEVRP